MKYILRLSTLGQHPDIEIEQDRFFCLKTSRVVLDEALAFEEKYEMVICSYLDLEKEVADVSLSSMIRSGYRYTDFFNARLSLNMRLVNLLAWVRAYTYQLAGHLSACMPNEHDVEERIKKLFSTEYDNHFEYRFMEALRNHVQHRDTPVRKIILGSKWTSIEDDGLLEFSSTFSAEKKNLAEDPHFKKRVLDEMPEEVDLCAVTRSYIESVSTIHCQA